MDDHATSKNVDEFIVEKIDGVPHLEALLLIWNRRPQTWSVDDIARALYVHADVSRKILEDLKQRFLIADDNGKYFYEESEEKNKLMSAVDRTYRSELVRISRMIHAKSSPALRDFARAFRIKDGKDKS
jgi:hypothetical protein